MAEWIVTIAGPCLETHYEVYKIIGRRSGLFSRVKLIL